MGQAGNVRARELSEGLRGLVAGWIEFSSSGRIAVDLGEPICQSKASSGA